MFQVSCKVHNLAVLKTKSLKSYRLRFKSIKNSLSIIKLGTFHTRRQKDKLSLIYFAKIEISKLNETNHTINNLSELILSDSKAFG